MGDEHKVVALSCKDVEGIDHDGVKIATVRSDDHESVIVNGNLDGTVQLRRADDPEAVPVAWFDRELCVRRMGFVSGCRVHELVECAFACDRFKDD